MPRTLSANTQTESVKTVTRPLYLLEMMYSTPIRLSGREETTYDGDTYLSASMTINLTRPAPSVRFYDDDLQYAPIIIAQGTEGIAATLYQLYGEPPFDVSDADIFFSGELGPASIDRIIDLKMLETGPSFTPKIFASDDIFSHLPADGTEIVTRSGTLVLRRNN